MRTRWASLALLVAVGAAGCGTRAEGAPSSADVEPTRTAASTPVPELPEVMAMRTSPPGPDNFISEARMVNLGDKSLLTATDEAILGVGHSTCRLFDTQDASTPEMRRAGFEIIVQAVRTQTGADEISARTLMTLAVLNLCPVNADVLPPDAVS
ncbi:exported hypothetical protein [Frankia sp. Hr75.2]|nr:exported hypothetical protein [Frankia sp. Hr75.2]